MLICKQTNKHAFIVMVQDRKYTTQHIEFSLKTYSIDILTDQNNNHEQFRAGYSFNNKTHIYLHPVSVGSVDLYRILL